MAGWMQNGCWSSWNKVYLWMTRIGLTTRLTFTTLPELRLQVKARIIPTLEACRRRLEESIHDRWMDYGVPRRRIGLFCRRAVQTARLMAQGGSLAHCASFLRLLLQVAALHNKH
eukprot:1851500-Amphidinium_carterae.1